MELSLLRPGRYEGVKALWHGGLLVLALGAAAYNVAAFTVRPKPHLARNILLYGAIVAVEVLQIRHHTGRS